MTGLFLIGPSATGKTTRARRELVEFQQLAPRKKARAVPAKELMEEACAAIRADRFEPWRHQVRDLGFLVIEHLEDLLERPAARCELRCLVRDRIAAGGGVIVTATTSRSEIADCLAAWAEEIDGLRVVRT